MEDTGVSETGSAKSTDQTQSGPWWARQLLPLFGVGNVLIAMVLLYFSYDYVSARANPCETIFRQTKLGLSTKIGFLKTEGELKIGREPLVELTERAQMAALNLKTCCTVLDAGKLDPEQFLQCKAKARAYEARVGEIVTVVRKVVEVEAKTNTVAASDAVASGAAAPTPAPTVVAAQTEIKSLVEDARKVSK